MINAIKTRIASKTAEKEQKQYDERIVNTADKLQPSDVNDLMNAIGLPHLANFR